MTLNAKIIETRHISLPKGEILSIEMTQEFIDRVKHHFGILASQPLDDDYVRMYVWGAFNGAIDKIEQEMVKHGRK